MSEALHPSDRTRATYLAQNFAPLESSGRLKLVDGEQEIAPGVRLLPAPGHTADHQCVVIQSGGERAIYVGDLVQHGVQLERDPWISAFDVLPIISLETKKAILGRAAAENTLLISPHAAFPGAGRLTLEGNRRRFVPAEGLREEP
jgi:glyoxylase-like metal-dependent hydrolase (beta-lactamase superfamily II)